MPDNPNDPEMNESPESGEEEIPVNGNIIDVSISKQMKDAYITYALSVIK